MKLFYPLFAPSEQTHRSKPEPFEQNRRNDDKQPFNLTAVAKTLLCLVVLAGFAAAQAPVSSFQHIVLIVQENRTPDNLFQGLCMPPYGSASACGGASQQFDIRSYGFDVNGIKIPLSPVPLGNPYDPTHSHGSFEAMCNPDRTKHYPCSYKTGLSTSGCPGKCSFQYVDPTAQPTIYPYLYMAQNFGWANRMYQTNQGPSTPAHQYLFAGTSAPSALADAHAEFVSENPSGLGCLAPLGAIYYITDPAHAPGSYQWVNDPLGSSCFSHETMASVLERYNYSWRYYTIGYPSLGLSNSIWTAPNWIKEICQPNSTFTACTGVDWINNVDLEPSDVLLDVQKCNLKNMVWVIPKGQYSDHPPDTGIAGDDGGPAWVANVVNAVSNSPCSDDINGVDVPYWQDTAIVVTWDDWGGFYDHVLPPFRSAPNLSYGDYELGFRVPLLFISAYTNPTVNGIRYDFGSILRFAEGNFGIPEGAIGFGDKRSPNDLRAFYNFQLPPKKFLIPTSVPASAFLNDAELPEPPDND